MAHRKELILIKAAKNRAKETRVRAECGKGKAHLPPVSYACGAAVGQGLLEDFPAQVFSKRVWTPLNLCWIFQAQTSRFLQPPSSSSHPPTCASPQSPTCSLFPVSTSSYQLSFSQAMFHARN